jgi:uncharacterized SAM-binding protein YcdF (DUF218 family)
MNPAEILYSWLAMHGPVTRADTVIGFGHFDLAIPRRCVELVKSGAAQHIIFTGGIGAGTADLGKPEADAFADVVAADAPQYSRELVVENRSTNTAQNIQFTDELLKVRPAVAMGSVFLVATPCRQRRVWLTWRKHHPEIPAQNAAVEATYEETRDLYASKQQDIVEQLLGEWQRIRDYPAKGWIVADEIPQAVNAAAEQLLQARD